MTEKGHWCGMVKWSPKKRETVSIYCIYAVKLWNGWVIIVHSTFWPWKLKVDLEKSIDRALGISKRVVTDASVKRWANPVKNSRPKDRHTVALHTFYYSPCWNCCCLFEVKSTHSPCLPGAVNKGTESKIPTSSQVWWWGGIYIHCWP